MQLTRDLFAIAKFLFFDTKIFVITEFIVFITAVVGWYFSCCRFAAYAFTLQGMWKYLFCKIRLTGERKIVSFTAEESQL